MQNDKLTIRDKLTVVIIDRRTGKVKRVIKESKRNSVNKSLAGYIAGALTQGLTINAIDTLEILDSSGNTIKTFSVDSETVINPDSYLCRFIATDTSYDTYTTSKQRLKSGNSIYFVNVQDFSKGTYDAVRYVWEVTIPYQTEE